VLKTDLYSAIKSEDSEELDSGTSQLGSQRGFGGIEMNNEMNKKHAFYDMLSSCEICYTELSLTFHSTRNKVTLEKSLSRESAALELTTKHTTTRENTPKKPKSNLRLKQNIP